MSEEDSVGPKATEGMVSTLRVRRSPFVDGKALGVTFVLDVEALLENVAVAQDLRVRQSNVHHACA